MKFAILSIALAAVTWLLGWRMGRVSLLRDLKRRLEQKAKAAVMSGRR